MSEITDVKSALYHVCGNITYRILPETETDQVAISGSTLTLSEYLAQIDRNLGGTLSTRFASNIATRNGLAGVEPGDRVYVLDASDDDQVIPGHGAFYIYLPSYQWRLVGSDAKPDASQLAEKLRGFALDDEGKLELLTGAGLALDEDGKLAASLGEGLANDENGAIFNLAPVFNRRVYITESGDWEAPVTGWCKLQLISGGDGGVANVSTGGTWGGLSGIYLDAFARLQKGQIIPVTIGAGGIGKSGTSSSVAVGGHTSFGDISTASPGKYIGKRFLRSQPHDSNDGNTLWSDGCGLGHGSANNPNWVNAQWYGGGGAVICHVNNAAASVFGNGYQGCVMVDYYDPDYDPEAGEEE